jgi:isopenicillin N synthase-like dioxygenase
LIIIDVDGTDYWLMHDLLKANFRPQVICVEFNPSMPDDLIYIPPRDDAIRQGTSLSALVELASKYNYQLCETTCYNAFFVDLPLYHKYVKKDIPFDPTIERLHEVTMGTNLYQLYDGKLKISGCKKLLWHRIPILEENIQVLQNEADRSFPFVPGASSTTGQDSSAIKQKLGDTSQTVPPDDELEFFKSISIDMSSYCQSSSSSSHPSDRKRCSKQLLDTLKQDGFAHVRGTGISKKICQDALKWSHEFLQEAPEAVRRSCLTKDRARRGYSPQNAENFASLIGEKGPNDLVKKFRVGPEESGGEHFSLMQSNAWPSECDWEHSKTFQNCIEAYYDEICDTAHAIVSSICDGLNSSMNEFSKGFDGSAIERESHTSILTMLGYRKGARHQGCKKPLVAAHTDVGVITVLLFDRGSVATLQKLEDHNWIDVKLPNNVPQDPIFVVNIGDCLSELCNSEIPSTMHRVMPERGTTPRNSLALFVGFRTDQILQIGGKKITYEEWRKQKIKKAQQQQQQMQKNECSN